MKKAVKTASYLLAEETLRLACHEKVIEAFKATKKELMIEGCGVVSEPGKQNMDEYGFLESAGGFEAYRAGTVKLVPFFNQAAFVDKVVDKKVKQMLEKAATAACAVLPNYSRVAQEKQKDWLKSGGQQAIDTATADGTVADVQVPVAKFHKSALTELCGTLRPKMIEMGGKAAERAEMTQALPGSRSTDLRRETSQLIQQMAVDVFFASAGAVTLERNLEAIDWSVCPEDSKESVETEAFDVAESTIRKAVHTALLDEYKSVTKLIKIDPCSTLKETAEVQPEDEYGFLTSAGGYSEYKLAGLVVPDGAIALASAAEATSAEQAFGFCRVCSKQLHVYGADHACFAEFGKIDEWECDVCGLPYGESDQLFCCSTFDQCDWGACGKCQELPDPQPSVDTVMDSKVTQKLEKVAFAASSVMGNFTKVAQQKQQEWLSDEGQALIDKATADGTLADVLVPVATFQIEGLHSVKDGISPKMLKMVRLSPNQPIQQQPTQVDLSCTVIMHA